LRPISREKGGKTVLTVFQGRESGKGASLNGPDAREGKRESLVFLLGDCKKEGDQNAFSAPKAGGRRKRDANFRHARRGSIRRGKKKREALLSSAKGGKQGSGGEREGGEEKGNRFPFWGFSRKRGPRQGHQKKKRERFVSCAAGGGKEGPSSACGSGRGGKKKRKGGPRNTYGGGGGAEAERKRGVGGREVWEKRLD